MKRMKRHRPARIGLSAMLALLAGTTWGCGPGPAPPQPTEKVSAKSPVHQANIVIFLVDTLRADALGFMGYPRPVSPRLDAWAEKGVIFEAATTPAGWTRPAVVSLFSGLYPASHGVQDKEHVAPESLSMLAEVLGSVGYQTTGLVSNFAASGEFGLGQGFDRYKFFDKTIEAHPDDSKRLNYVSIAGMDAEVRAFLSNPPAEPFFLYVHTTDPHAPYIPGPKHRLFGRSPRDRYDGEVHYTDHYIGSWLDLMQESGLLDRSVVLLTADHGEEFEEHGGIGHGITVFDECVRVPLVLWSRDVQPGRRRALVSLADIPATLLEAARMLSPSGFAEQSRSFWEIATEQDRPDAWSWAYSELVYPSKGIAFAYREGESKAVHIVRDRYRPQGGRYLFDLATDPHEQINLFDSKTSQAREIFDKLRSVRSEHLERMVESETQPLEGDALERMRSLGYVD